MEWKHHTKESRDERGERREGAQWHQDSGHMPRNHILFYYIFWIEFLSFSIKIMLKSIIEIYIKRKGMRNHNYITRHLLTNHKEKGNNRNNYTNSGKDYLKNNGWGTGISPIDFSVWTLVPSWWYHLWRLWEGALLEEVCLGIRVLRVHSLAPFSIHSLCFMFAVNMSSHLPAPATMLAACVMLPTMMDFGSIRQNKLFLL